MIEVEIKRLKYFGNEVDESHVDSFYFNGENDYDEAIEFANQYNQEAVITPNEYKAASKPRMCHSFSLTEVLGEALDDIKRSLGNLNIKYLQLDLIRNRESNEIHNIAGDHF